MISFVEPRINISLTFNLFQGSSDSLFFSQNKTEDESETETEKNSESQFAALSLTNGDTLSLINFNIFDQEVSQMVNDTIVRSGS